MLFHSLIGVLLKGGGHGVQILTFEEYQVAILPLNLKGGEVDAVFPCDFCEGADILVGHFDALHTLVLGCKLFDSHPAMKLFGLLPGLHMLQKLRQCLSELLFCQLAAVDDQGDNFLFNLFLQDSSTPFFGFAGG